jgi:8-oxo-dGTP pyrophosphatase MutT (NUDIX family)
MTPTHAGAVVYRSTGSSPELLLVTSKSRPEQWVLPKGHIEPGEAPERAAVREVAEETGTFGIIEAYIDDVSIVVNAKPITIRYYLIHAEQIGNSPEGRSTGWFPLDAALARASFDETRRTLSQAIRIIEARRGDH